VLLACGHHDFAGVARVCTHVRQGTSHHERFTGQGIEAELVCEACLESTSLDAICLACRDEVRKASARDGHLGNPGIVEEPSTLRFEHLPPIAPRVGPLLDLRPMPAGDRDCWLGVTAHRELVELDLDRDEVRCIATLPEQLFELAEREGLDDSDSRDPPALTLHVSRDGRLAAIVQQGHGLAGLVIDLETGEHLMPLTRDTYCAEHCIHSFAFLEYSGRTLIVHATAWNRLDVHDPRTRELLTPRGPTSYTRDKERPPHYLNYFHCRLTVSPDQRRIVDDGWVWQPVGVLTTWRLDRWLTDNVWESEDGESRKTLAYCDQWDGPLCWIDEHRVAVWGYGEDDRLLEAVRIFDVEHGTESWFAGPTGEMIFDRVLLTFGSTGATVWNVDRGIRLLVDPHPAPTRYHPTAKTFVRWAGTTVYRSRLHGLDAAIAVGVIRELAERIVRERAFDDLPVLGDALEAAGCTDAEMLAHCQHPGPHGDRCWVVERLTR